MPQIATVAGEILGDPDRVRLEAYDGSSLGPPDAACRVLVRSPEALRHIIHAPSELGIGRAYVIGALDVEGDLLVGLQELMTGRDGLSVGPRLVADLLRIIGRDAVRRPAIPDEEVRLSGRAHDRERDAAAIAAHYDISNDFYGLVLGGAWTYSCAVFDDPGDPLDLAQQHKHELVSAKLGLEPGTRLLDVGCGWGSMAIHAARHHGAEVVGVTVSQAQADLARKRVVEAGVEDLVEIRVQDYRDVSDGPFDAVCSIGMMEHVGERRLDDYVSAIASQLAPGGRLLNHAIACWPKRRFGRRSPFIQRYVFPDGELLEVGTVISALQRHRLEVRHSESLREHYALTLRHWVENLDRNWDEAVDLVGERRARIWRLYLAASSINFQLGGLSIHQVLAVRADAGSSGLPLRPVFDHRLAATGRGRRRHDAEAGGRGAER